MRIAIGRASGPRGKGSPVHLGPLPLAQAARRDGYVLVYQPLGRRSVEVQMWRMGIVYYLCHFIEVTKIIMSFLS
jgi:hypothetical protein